MSFVTTSNIIVGGHPGSRGYRQVAATTQGACKPGRPGKSGSSRINSNALLGQHLAYFYGVPQRTNRLL
jgi:hypothetical protein